MCRTTRISILAAFAVASQLPAAAQKAISLTWTMYPSYTDPVTQTVMTSGISGDGTVLGDSGSTIYANNNSAKTYVEAAIKSGGAVLNVGGSRTIHASLARFLGSSYNVPSPGFTVTGQTININQIQQCQSDGCVFYTVMTSTYAGSSGGIYGLPMRSLDVDVNWPPAAEGNCAYNTSRIRVEFHAAGHSGYKKNTWLVTPELQTVLTPGYIPGATFQTSAGSCPNQMFPGNSDVPAAVASLMLNANGVAYNYGQYSLPFYFKIEQN